MRAEADSAQTPQLAAEPKEIGGGGSELRGRRRQQKCRSTRTKDTLSVALGAQSVVVLEAQFTRPGRRRVTRTPWWLWTTRTSRRTAEKQPTVVELLPRTTF